MKDMDLGGDEYSSCMTRDDKRPNMSPTVYLSDEQVQALGITGARVGEKFMLHAEACVVSVSSHEKEADDGEGETNVSVTLRLDAAEVVRAAKAASTALYGA
jgi:hypothetical protein